MITLSVELSLDNPCSEDWALMTPMEQGRFCSSCQKTVVDMTAWTEPDIAQYFSMNPVGTCGRFREDQLNRRLGDRQHVRQKKKPAYEKALALIISFFALGSASAQRGQDRAGTEQTAALPQSDLIRISGTVTDSGSVPLAGVSIGFNGKNYRTDPAGDYVILVSRAEMQNGNLIFSFDGLTSEVRSYNTAMHSTRYDVQLKKASGVRYSGGAPVARFYLPDDGKSNFVTVQGKSLDSVTRHMLAGIAAMLQANPMSRVVLQSYYGRGLPAGVDRALLIQNYFTEKLYIDENRLRVARPMKAKSAADRNRVYLLSGD